MAKSNSKATGRSVKVVAKIVTSEGRAPRQSKVVASNYSIAVRKVGESLRPAPKVRTH